MPVNVLKKENPRKTSDKERIDSNKFIKSSFEKSSKYCLQQTDSNSKQAGSANTYKKEKADLYKLDLSDEKDKRLLKSLAENWGDDSYTINLHEDLKAEFIKPQNAKKEVYVLVNPKTCINNFDDKNVLGVVSVNKNPKKYVEVDFLQVNPAHLLSKTYKKIGERIMDCMKILYMEKPLHVMSDENATGFYEKIGFEKIHEDGLDYVWYG